MKPLIILLALFNFYIYPLSAQDSLNIDHSSEWADPTEFLDNATSVDFSQKILNYNLSKDWTTENSSLDGFIGSNYYRIFFHLSSIKKDPVKKNLYHVIGKDKLRNNICDFNGTLTLLKAYKYYFSDSTEPYILVIGEYVLYEDNTKAHSGIFKGSMRSFYRYDTNKKTITMSESEDEGGRKSKAFTFVGTWKEYNSTKYKQCIWGADRFPYASNFDVGCCCGMSISEIYRKYGWETWGETNKKGQLLDDLDKWWKK